jgi:hypothetical protein
MKLSASNIFKYLFFFFLWISFCFATEKPDLNSQVIKISDRFLGKPYLLGALGEGNNGDFDQRPIYRDDRFDCQTLVSTVLAVLNSNSPEELEKNIIKINYQNDQVSFLTRNHFTNLDWNVKNQKNGFLCDVTDKIIDREKHPVFLTSKTIINKKAWLQKRLARNSELMRLAKQEKPQLSIINYLPWKKLFPDGTPDFYLFNQIPTPSIIEIVRPNWNLEKKIGTRLDVSHLGIVFRRDNQLIFREASSLEKKVIDLPLIEYLASLKENPTIGGINVEMITPPLRKGGVYYLRKPLTREATATCLFNFFNFSNRSLIFWIIQNR